MKKRLLTILLAIAMVFTTTPVMALPVYADTDAQTVTEEMDAVTDDVAGSGETEESLTDAPQDTDNTVLQDAQQEDPVTGTDVQDDPVAAPAEDDPIAAPAEVKDTDVAKVNDTGYATLQEALDAAQAGDTVTLLTDVDMTSYYGSNTRFPISKSITIDGAGKTITVAGRGFGVGLNASGNIDVTFKDVTIVNASAGARCIDTRGNINSLTLSGVTLKTDGGSGYVQPLTIGGNQSFAAKISISNSTIQTNDDATAYYAIITFNPVDMTITNSTIKGWACLYCKGPDSSAGSAGSTVNISNSNLISNNTYNGTSNAFAAITCEDNNVEVNIADSNINVTANSDQKQAIAAGAGVKVTLGSGNVVTLTGENAVYAFNDPDNDPELTITGGKYNTDPSNFLEKGLTAKKTGDTYTVVKTNLDDIIKVKDIEAQTYTGSAIEPAAELEARPGFDDIDSLVKDTDYTVSYSGNTNVGKADVTVSGKGNYTGSITKKFDIVAADISTTEAAEISNQFYTGEEIKPEVALTLGDYKLVKGTDYDVAYSNNKEVGTATITVTGKGNFTGTKTVTFKIAKAAAMIGDQQFETFEDAIAAANAMEGEVTIDLLTDVTWTTGASHGSTPFLTADSAVTTLTINGNNHKLTAVGQGIGSIRAANDGMLKFKNMTIKDESQSYAESSWEHGYLEFGGKLDFSKVDFVNAVMLTRDNGQQENCEATFTDCSFNSNAANEYDIWVSQGDATFTNCEFTGYRGAKTHEAYGSEVGTLTFTKCDFKNLSKKPGLAVGTVNADTTVIFDTCTFENVQAGDQGLYVLESDTTRTDYNMIIKGTAMVDDVDAVVAKIGDRGFLTVEDAFATVKPGETLEILKAGKYTLPSSLANITVQGDVEGVVFEHTTAGNISTISDGITFKNVTFNFGSVNYHGFQHAGTIKMDGCTINGKFFSYGEMNFTKCTFNAPGTSESGVSGSDYSMWAYAGNLTFDDCVFNSAGKIFNVYNENGTTRYTVTANDCVFKSTKSSKAAFNVKETCGEKTLQYTVNINNCTAEGAFPEASESDTLTVISGLAQVDDRVKGGTVNGGEIIVNIDNVLKYSTPRKARVAAIGETEYLTLEDAFAAATEMGGNVTIDVYEGVVEIPATASIPANVTIKGAGKDKTTLKITTSNGDGIKLTNPNVTIKDLAIDGSNITSGGYKSLVNVEADGCVIDNVAFSGGGKSTWNPTILVEKLTADQTFTVKNSTITGSFRGVLRESCNANINIDGCEIDAVYPFNIDGGKGGEIKVTGSKLHGWTSYSGVEKVTFTNCEFSKGNSGYDCVAAYVNTEFNGCTFDNDFKVYAQTSPFDFTFNDCVKNGEDVTRDDFKEQFPDDSDVWTKCNTYVNSKLVGAVAEVAGSDSTKEYKTLQAAIDAAHEMTGDVTVTMLADVQEVALIHQKAGLNLTVDGAGKTITGQFYVDGDGRYNDADTLTIKNVKFAYDAATYDDAFIDVPSTKTADKVYTTGKYNYAHNLTVENCEFTGEGTTTVAVRVASNAGAHGVTISGNTAEGGHSFAQLIGVKDLTVTNNTVTGVKNGINISGGDGTAVISNNKLTANASETEGYTLRIKDASGINATLEDNIFSGVEGIIDSASVDSKISITSGYYNGPLSQPNKGKIVVTGGFFTVKPANDQCGKDEAGNQLYPVASGNALYPYTVASEVVAKVGDVNYTSLPDAVAAAKDGETVELLKDASGAGVMIKAADAKNITIDFGGNTYTIDSTLVGSTGTESQAMHFEKGCDITLKNGTLTSTNASMLVQNYGNLTVEENMILDGTKSADCGYVVSNNCGAVTIKGQIKANENAYAFDVCVTNYYPDGAQVTVENTAVIKGDIQYDVWGTKPEDNKATLTVNGGKFTGKIVVDEALKEDAKTHLVINDGLFKIAPSDEYVVTGKAAVANLDEATKADYPFTIGEAVAKIGDVNYPSLPAAVAAAQNGETVELLKDASGAGVMIKAADAKNITIDFGGHTYTIDSTLVGSTGTESQAMHFEKGCDITLKNGTLTSTNASMLVQNYGNLTVEENMILDGTKSADCGYVVSNNCGAVTIKGQIKANENAYAFDVCVTNYYPDGAQVTVENTAVIKGDIQYDVWGTKPEDNKATLTVNGGKFTGKIVVDEALKEDAKTHLVINDGLFKIAPSDEYVVTGKAAVANLDEATKADYPFTIGEAVAKIGDVNYTSLPDAVAAAKDGETVELLKDASGAGVMIKAADAKNITIDFGGNTYTIDSTLVGSTGTKSQAMHFEKGCDITLKNGTLTSTNASMLVQNYGNLTVEENMILDGTKSADCGYVVSNNCGAVTIKGQIKANENAYAFDVCVTNYYPDGAQVTVENTAVIKGDIQYDVWGTKPEDNKATLTVNGGKFTGKIVVDEALKEDAKTHLVINDGLFKIAPSDEYVVTGKAAVANLDEATKADYPFTIGEAVAKIGDVNYPSLPAAVAAAQNGETVELLKDASGAGVMIKAADAKNITIDFGGHTYTIDSTLVGSTGTESQAMHFEKGCDITLKNGTLTSTNASMLVQNYGNLTVEENMILDGTKSADCGYVVSNNCGAVTIKGQIKANENAYAFDVCVTNYYPDGAQVTVENTAVIKGDIQYDVWGTKPEDNKATLTVNGGKFTGKIVVDEALKEDAKTHLVINDGLFKVEPSDDYVADGKDAVANLDEATKAEYPFTIGEAVAETGGVNYTTLAKAMEVAEAGGTVKLLKDTQIESIEVAKKVTLDLDGHEVSSDAPELFAITEDGDLTITGNGKITGPANGKTFDSRALITVDGGKLTVLDGTLTATGEGSDGMYGVYVSNSGTAVFGAEGKEGPAITSHFAAIGTNNTTAPANITVYSGTYTANAKPTNNEWWSYFCAPVYAAAAGTFDLQGGTFNGYYGISSRYANVEQTIKMGNVTMNASSGTQVFVDEQSGAASAADRHIQAAGNTLTLPEVYAWRPISDAGDMHYEVGFSLKAFDFKAENKVYNGTAQEAEPVATPKFENAKVTAEDYTLSYKDADGKAIEGAPVNAGTYTVVAKGTEGSAYEGTESNPFTFEITQADLADCEIAKIDDQEFTGSAITPAPVVTLGDYTLKEGTDYTVSYENNTNVGTATVKLTAVDGGNFKGTNATTFNITAKDISEAVISGIESGYDYTGSPITDDFTVMLGDTELKADTDYTFEYKENTRTGVATLTVTGTGNYTGSVSTDFRIHGTSINDADVTIEEGPFVYDGTAKTPKVESVKMTINGKEVTLVENKDFTVNYTNNVNAGTAQVVLFGKADFSGGKIVEFTIDPAQVEIPVAKEGLVYSGEPQTGVEAAENAPYTLSGNVQTDAGEYAAMAALNSDNYVWKNGKTENQLILWSIAPKEITPVIAAIDDQTHTGEEVTPAVTVTAEGESLTEADYEVAYSNNVEVGEATVTVTMKGNYTGTATAKFNIVHKHTLTEVDAKAATCTEDGNIEYWTCSNCGKLFSDEEGKTEITAAETVIAKTGHTAGEPVRENEKEATCTEAGSYDEVVYCTVCGEEISRKTKAVDAIGHDWKDLTVIKAPTCTEAGVKIQKCENDALHLQVVDIPATGHKQLTKVEAKAATCTEDGNAEHWTCEACGMNFSDAEGKTPMADEDVIIKATGHKMAHHEAVEATCTTAGNIEYWTCETCGKYFGDGEGTVEYTGGAEDVLIKAEGHDMEHHEAVDATCEEDGNIEYWTCSTCGKYFSDEKGETEITAAETVAAATGHSLKKTEAKAATCTTKGNIAYWTCEDCGKVFSDAEGKTEITMADAVTEIDDDAHAWGEWQPIKAATCTEGGLEYRVCSRKSTHIEFHKTEATGHNPEKVEAKAATCKAEGNSEYYVCSECGKYFADEACTQEIKLEDTVIEKIAHTWGEWKITSAATCEEEGVQTHTCSVCGETEEEAIPAIGHAWGEETTLVEAGCTTFGLTRKICENDSEHVDYTVVPPTGHNLKHVEEKAATCTENGAHEHWYCNKCGKYYSDADAKTEIKESEAIIFATGHAMTRTPAKAATCHEEGNIEYWHCETCDKYFGDAEGTTEITQASTVTAKTKHSLSKVDAKTPTHKKVGNIEYYICDNCGDLFLDAKGTQPTTWDEVLLKRGWLLEDAEWYYYIGENETDKGTKLRNGWASDSVGWCWLGDDAKITKDEWIQDKGEWYYLKPNGYMAVNEWAEDSVGRCYMNGAGRLTKNKWINSGNEWYYMNANGYVTTNAWAKDSQGWCWMDAEGKITKSKWILDNGEWYYLKSNGYMAANEWAKDSTGWLYMEGNGKAARSKWIQYNGSWYYLNANGYMVTGTQTINGTTYRFDSSGKWIQ